MSVARWFCSTSRVRTLIDVLWVGGFIAVATHMFVESRSFPSFQSGVQLSLVEGAQRRGIYRDGRKLGEIVHDVRRKGSGWRLVERFASAGADLGQVELELREDLSLRGMRVDIDLAALTGVYDAVASLTRLLGGSGKLQLEGSCSMRTGECLVEGTLGKRRISHAMMVGRGPVLPSAVYPLLARGVLGKRVELHLLDPLSLQRRAVTFTLVGRRKLQLGTQSYDAILVQQRFSGLDSKLWLDRRGRVLKEQLPLGLWVQHESWNPALRGRSGPGSESG